MIYEWDDNKNKRNVRERGIDFASVENFEWPNALILEDTRHDYGEQRFQAVGMINRKLHVMVYTERQQRTRIISLRRANAREEAIYEQTYKT